MKFYERLSGVRMHAAFVLPSSIAFDLPLGCSEDVNKWCEGDTLVNT
jgi:NADH:ubiquinone oxidoreductase subunit D